MSRIKKVVAVTLLVLLCPVFVLGSAEAWIDFSADLPVLFFSAVTVAFLFLVAIGMLCIRKWMAALFCLAYMVCGTIGTLGAAIFIGHQCQAARSEVRAIAGKIEEFKRVEGRLPKNLYEVFGDQWVAEVNVGLFLKRSLSYEKYGTTFYLEFIDDCTSYSRYSSDTDRFNDD